MTAARNDLDPEPGISDRDRAIFPGAKATAIREQLDLTEVRYYARLNWLIDQPAALEADPMTVRRLHRVRDRRRAQRSGGVRRG